jgi:hypothetical protein
VASPPSSGDLWGLYWGLETMDLKLGSSVKVVDSLSEVVAREKELDGMKKLLLNSSSSKSMLLN